MRKRFTLVLWLMFGSVSIWGQLVDEAGKVRYGNEWIDYGQNYFRIPIASDGVYRLDYRQLSAAGVPLTTLPGDRFQLFRFGEEQPIYVSSGDQPLEVGDYIEFVGQRNRGELDAYGYADPATQQLNSDYSLVTDTAAYFLTWGDEPGLRYATVTTPHADTSGAAVRSWHRFRRQVNYANRYYKTYVKVAGFDIYRSEFNGDGFATGLRREHSYRADLDDLATDRGPATVHVRLITNLGGEGHDISITLDDQELIRDAFTGVGMRHYQFEIPIAALQDRHRISIRSLLDNNDRFAVAAITVDYPRKNAFGPATASRLEIPASGRSAWFSLPDWAGDPAYAPRRGERYLPDSRGRIWWEAGDADELFFNLPGQFFRPDTLIPVDFRSFEDIDADYILLTHPQLRSDATGTDWVAEYAAYRSSPEGGGYRPQIIEIQELYEQFGYGIQRHGVCLKNFANYLKAIDRLPAALFIIGKGRELPDMRSAGAVNNAAGNTFFVPSYGHPVSDHMAFSEGNAITPLFPVGRLAAKKPADVALYLDKVRGNEANQLNPQTFAERSWMKNVLHLGGGNSQSEQNFIRSTLEGLAGSLERSAYGAEVSAFYKRSADPIEVSLSDQIFDRINRGVSAITFLGHSGQGNFDFSIDNPDNYNNTNRYPVMYSLGCYAGNIFAENDGISERFIFLERKGAVAFAASRGLGFLSSLVDLGEELYRKIGDEYYGSTIGESLLYSFEELTDNIGVGNVTLIQQFILHGDPALQLFPSEGPDYLFAPNGVRFNPERIAAEQDSFSVAIDLANLGRYNFGDSLDLEVRFQLASGQLSEDYAFRLPAPAFRSSHVFTFPVLEDMLGRNRLLAEIRSPGAETPAAASQNNVLIGEDGRPGAPFFVIDNAVRPLSPPEFGMLPVSDSLTLRAYTANVHLSPQTYFLEIDTVGTFDSPFKRRSTLQVKGGLITHRQAALPEAGRVYYWRVSPDSTSADLGFTWSESSFYYSPDPETGWYQGHRDQLQRNDLDDLQVEADGKLQFSPNILDFQVTNRIWDNTGIQPQCLVNGVRWAEFFPWEMPNSINVVFFDTLGRFQRNPNPGLYGSVQERYQNPSACFAFPVSTPEERLNLIHFLRDTVPDGFEVVLYTAQRRYRDSLFIQDWAADSLLYAGANLFNVLENQGAGLIRQLKNDPRPYVFHYRKGGVVYAEQVAADPTGTVFVNAPIRRFWPRGKMRSVPLGPASAWESLHWEMLATEAVDTFFFSVFGVRADGTTALLFDELTQSGLDLRSIRADEYPYLQLQFTAEDVVNTTSPDLAFWKINYRGVPELAVDPNTYLQMGPDSLEQGDSLRLALALTNVGEPIADSITTAWQTSGESGSTFFYTLRVPGLFVDETDTLFFRAATTEWVPDRYRFQAITNPDSTIEEYTFLNNTFLSAFDVRGDDRPPLLDITYDGRYIMEGELISANPTILIRTTDDNAYFSVGDTSLYDMRLTYPDGKIERIHFSLPWVQLNERRDSTGSVTEILLTPGLTQSGVYQLTVSAEDAAGNAAGGRAYRKSFEIERESKLRNLYNYPNPFTTSTRFQYTLTGDRPIHDYLIRIYTISGRVVREITPAEMGPLEVGTHLTDYAWDGRDNFGDRLANGIYLYQFMVRDEEGEIIPIEYTEGVAAGMENGFGKMVLLR